MDISYAVPYHFLPLRLFVILRWIALLGQGCTVAVVVFILQYQMPLSSVILILCVSGIMHIFLTLHPSDRLTPAQILLCLAYDLGQLTTMLFVTGGLNNPFSILLIAPVVVAAGFLAARQTLLLCGLCLLLIGVLACSPFPLPWYDQGVFYPLSLRLGIGVALVTTILFTAYYVWYVAYETRKLSQALTATQLALGKEQKISSLGALAAAAAHELGSPLTTITLVAKELRQQMTSKENAEDVDLILTQAYRCRDLLQDLSRNFAQDYQIPLDYLPISAALRVILERFKGPKTVALVVSGVAEVMEPKIHLTPEIIHGLGNIIENACQFAQKSVRIYLSWTSVDMKICVEDDGPGYADDVLKHLGNPYVSGRLHQEDCHLGLGLFIAQTLLARHGVKMYFSNNTAPNCTGAQCHLLLPIYMDSGEKINIQRGTDGKKTTYY